MVYGGATRESRVMHAMYNQCRTFTSNLNSGTWQLDEIYDGRRVDSGSGR